MERRKPINILFRTEDVGEVITREFSSSVSFEDVYNQTQMRIRRSNLFSQILSEVSQTPAYNTIPSDITNSLIELGEFLDSSGARRRELRITDENGRQVLYLTAFTDYSQLYPPGDSTITILERYSRKNKYTGSFYFTISNRVSLLARTTEQTYQHSNEIYDCVLEAIRSRELNKPWGKEGHTILDLKTTLHPNMKKVKKKERTEEQQKIFKSMTKRLSKLKVFEKHVDEYNRISKENNGLTKRQIEELATKISYTIRFKSILYNSDDIFVANGSSSTNLVLVNTELNHLEKPTNRMCRVRDIENRRSQLTTINIDTYEEMDTIIRTKKIDVYWKDTWGISTIYDMDNIRYVVQQRAREIEKEFRKRNSIDDLVWEFEPNTPIHNFADNMNGVAGCVDFKNIDYYTQLETKSQHLVLVDRTKSYYNYDKLPNYRGGVAGKFLHIARMPPTMSKTYKTQKQDLLTKCLDNYVGFFCINNITFNHKKSKQINDKLKYIRNGCIYLGETLQLLDELNITYTITHYALFTRVSFTFTEDTKTRYSNDPNDKEQPPIYSKIIGKMMIVNGESSYYIRGDRKWGEELKHQFETLNNGTQVYINPNNVGELQLVSKNKLMRTNVHQSATITHLQHICVFKQLLELDPTKIVRVVGDGIYFEKHPYKLLETHGFREEVEESKFKLSNFCGSVFTSQMPVSWTDFVNFNVEETTYDYHDSYIVKNRRSEYDLDIDYKPQEYTTEIPKPYKEVELWLGSGGSGKSYTFFKKFLKENNIGLHEYCFLCPTHSLKEDIQTNYSNYIPSFSQINTRHKLTAETCVKDSDILSYLEKYSHITEKKRVLVLDEFTMCDSEILYEFIERYRYDYRIIIIGDADFFKSKGKYKVFSYQLSNGNYDELLDYIPTSNITFFKDDHRARDQELKELKQEIRENIKNYEISRHDLNMFERRCFHMKPVREILESSKIKRIKYHEINKHINVERGDVIVSSYNYLEPSKFQDPNTKEWVSPKEDRKNFYQKRIDQEYKRWLIQTKTTKTYVVSKTKPPHSRECYSTSVNQIQGHTIEGASLFIDYRNEFCMFSLQHLYVAISRVRNFNQLYIII